MNRLAIFKSIAEEASHGELVFPTKVEESLKLKRLLDDPDCHVDSAIRLIQADPLIAARSVSLANSAAYRRSGTTVTNVRQAIARLGFTTLRTVVASVIIKQLNCLQTDPQLKAMAAQLWEHSAHVAALAQVIAKHVPRVNPETAFFAGLMHEVGGFYLLSRAEEFPGLLNHDSEDEVWTEYGEKLIGKGVLHQLGIPSIVIQAIEKMWLGLSSIPPESLADTLILANDMASVHSPLHQGQSKLIRQHLTHLDFEIDDSTLQEILNETDEEVESVANALLI